MALGKSLGNILGNYFGDEQVVLNGVKKSESTEKKYNENLKDSSKPVNKSISVSTDTEFSSKNLDRSESIIQNGINYVDSISIDDILPNPYQTRSFFDSDKITSLAANIRENGLIQPIVVLVRPKTILISHPSVNASKSNNEYVLLAGERRLRACKLLGWRSILCVVKDSNEIDPKHQCLLSAMENLQREDLSPIELSKTFALLMQTQELNEAGIAQLIDKSSQYVKNYLRLLNLHPEIQQMLLHRKLNEAQARHLVGLDPNIGLKIAQTIVEKELTVKEVIRLIDNLTNTQSDQMPIRTNSFDLPDYYIKSTKRLADEIPSSKVKYFGNVTRGKIVISWSN